MSKAFEKAYKG